MADDVIVLDGVSKAYRIYQERNQDLKRRVLCARRARYEEFWAARDVTLSVHEGEVFGIIGPNGSGKSTTLKLIAGILAPDGGTVTTRGSVGALLELGAGFHPELTGRENVYLNGALLGISRKVLDQRFDEIVDFAGLGPFIDNPIKTYSSGMYVRLGFSVAVNVEPDVLLIDEVLAVGDEVFQRRCLDRIDEMRRSGRTIVIVSHGLELVRKMCARVAWIERGTVRGVGPARALVDEYLAASRGGELAAATELHSGTGEVRITDISISTDQSATLRTGDACIVRLRVSCQQGDLPISIRLGVRNSDGLEVAADETPRTQPLELPAGSTTVAYRIPRLPLMSGEYHIDVRVIDPSTQHLYDEIVRAHDFEVSTTQLDARGGVVSLLGEWQPLRGDS